MVLGAKVMGRGQKIGIIFISAGCAPLPARLGIAGARTGAAADAVVC